jgi:hypothetical protein
MQKKFMKYLSQHPLYTAFLYFIIGTGFGILISRPLGVHPVRYGVALLAIGTVGKLYVIMKK